MFFLLWLIIFCLGLRFLVPHLRRKFSDSSFYESVTIDKAPNIDEYIDLKNGFKMDVRDKFKYMSMKLDDARSKKNAEEPFSDKMLKKIFK